MAKVRSKVITCNHCGTKNPAGTMHCQRCGLLLTNMGNSGMYSTMESRGGGAANESIGSGVSQEQPVLPAWLESLRSGMGDAPATSGNQSDNDFSDRNNNRPYTSGQWENTKNANKNGNPYEQPEQNSAPPSFHVADLIDDNSLPSWLRLMGETGQAAPAPTSTPETPKTQSTLRPASYRAPDTDENYFPGRENNSRGIAANSLVDAQSLPPWMQQEQTTTPQENQRNIPASSLVQPDAMPDWMKNMQAPTAFSTPSPSSPSTKEPARADTTSPFHASTQANSQPMPSVRQGFAARDLIDQQSLPPWMKQQDGQEVAPGQMGQSGPISASSFIDMNALPPWLRQNEGNQPSQNPIQQGPEYNGYNRQNAQSTPTGPQRPAYPVPPRAENIRVPSRPRSEMAPNEGNEVAANVFASMLGVASTTPNFPPSAPQGYPGTPQGPQGFPGGQGASAIPPYGTMNGTQPPPGPGTMPPQQPGYPGYMQGGYPGQGTHQSGYLGGKQGQGNYPMDNASASNNAMMPPPNTSWQQPGMQNFGPNQYPQNMGNPAMANEQQANTKPAKRGLFEAIRSWLFRS